MRRRLNLEKMSSDVPLSRPPSAPILIELIAGIVGILFVLGVLIIARLNMSPMSFPVF